MRKLRITDFDIGVGWRTPNYYRTVSEWLLDTHVGPPLNELLRNRKRGMLVFMMASITILGFFIQIRAHSVTREGA